MHIVGRGYQGMKEADPSHDEMTLLEKLSRPIPIELPENYHLFLQSNRTLLNEQ